MFIYCSTRIALPQIWSGTLICPPRLLLHSFTFPPARIAMQIKRRSDSGVSGQTARARSWVIAAAEGFYVSQFWPQWKSTCFYKSSPLRNTCTEQQAHCFPLSYVVKIERRARQHRAGLLNHSSFLAPLDWLRSSCHKHFIMSDVRLEMELVTAFVLPNVFPHADTF